MSEPLLRPRRKDPLKKTRLPLSPQAVRSRTAHGLTAAAAEGRFALQVCADCGTAVYPPRDACPTCLSPRLPFTIVTNGGTLLAETKLSNRGIGFLIINAYSTFNMPRMYALLIVLFVLSIGVNALVGKLGGVDSIKRA